MNMSQFGIPSVSLYDSLPLDSFKPYSMYCENHGNITALSATMAPCDVSAKSMAEVICVEKVM